jgi:hypothetical protein
MIRSTLATLTCLLGLAALALSEEPRSPAAIYTLPADGIWVEYDCQVADAAGKTVPATLRLSAVGTKDAREGRLRRIEMQLTVGRKDNEVRKLRQLLVSERLLKETGSLQASIVEVLARDENRIGVRRLSRDSVDDLIGLGIRDRRVGLRVLNEEAECETPLGKYRTRYITAENKREGRTLIYEGWLTSDVPFGWARFHIIEQSEQELRRTIFSATASGTGKHAQASLGLQTERRE